MFNLKLLRTMTVEYKFENITFSPIQFSLVGFYYNVHDWQWRFFNQENITA